MHDYYYPIFGDRETWGTVKLSNLPLATQLVSNRAGIQTQALNPVLITCSPSAIAQKTNFWQMSYLEKTTYKIQIKFMFDSPFLMLSLGVFLLYPIVYIKVNLNLYHCVCVIKDHPSIHPSFHLILQQYLLGILKAGQRHEKTWNQKTWFQIMVFHFLVVWPWASHWTVWSSAFVD